MANTRKPSTNPAGLLALHQRGFRRPGQERGNVFLTSAGWLPRSRRHRKPGHRAPAAAPWRCSRWGSACCNTGRAAFRNQAWRPSPDQVRHSRSAANRRSSNRRAAPLVISERSGGIALLFAAAAAIVLGYGDGKLSIGLPGTRGRFARVGINARKPSSWRLRHRLPPRCSQAAGGLRNATNFRL